MDNQPAPDSSPSNTGGTDATAAAWQDLLAELTELHARLEYLRLLLLNRYPDATDASRRAMPPNQLISRSTSISL
jgi:hypothetical protein